MTSASQPTSTFTPDQFKTYFSNANNRPANSSNQGLCDTVHPVGVAVGGNGQYGYKDDYIPHHEPFQYYASTANPHHLAPASLAAIGTDTQSFVAGMPQFDTANHQYDISDFNALVGAISHGFLSPDHLPAVSFLKAPGYEDGHAAYSDPYDEQQFVTSEINALEETPDWSSTAVIVTYDDSDGFYDHVYSGVHNPSDTTCRRLTARPAGLPHRHRAVRNGHAARGTERPLWLRPPAAAAGHLTVGEARRGRQHADRLQLDRQVHRGQLGPAPDPRLVRLDRRIARLDVRLPRPRRSRSCSSTR